MSPSTYEHWSTLSSVGPHAAQRGSKHMEVGAQRKLRVRAQAARAQQ